MEQGKNNLFITEILSRAFNLCKDNIIEILKVIGIFITPALIIPIILVYTVFATVLFRFSTFYYSYPNSFFDWLDTSISFGVIITIFLVAIILGLISLFGSLVIMKVLDDANKGNEVSWRSATKYVWSKKWSALGLNILVFLMFFITIFVLIILFGIISLVTLGLGLILLIPLFIALMIVIPQLMLLFDSTLIVNDLNAIDSIRETFLLFKRGYFWSTIGRLAAISGIGIVAFIVLMLFDFIPFIGFILIIIGQYIISTYNYAYLNVFVLDRNKPNIDTFRTDDENNNSGDNLIDPII